MSDEHIDQLLEQAKPSPLIPAAGIALSLHGLFVVGAGVQTLLFLQPPGLLAYAGFLLVGLGLLAMASGGAMATARGVAGWLAPIVAVLASGLAGGWFGYCTYNLIVMPLVLGAAVGGPVSVLLVLVALPGYFRTVRARLVLAQELDGVAPKGGNAGVVVALVGVAGVLGAGYLLLSAAGSGDPLTVAVVRRGDLGERDGSGAARKLAEVLTGRELAAVGVHEPLSADAGFDQARALAKQNDAAHVLVLDFGVSEDRAGIESGTKLYIVTGQAHLTSTATGAEVASSRTFEVAVEESTPSLAIAEAGEALAEAWGPFALRALFASPAFQPVLEGSVDTSKITRARTLSRLRGSVEVSGQRAAELAAWCEEQRERMEPALAEEAGVSCIGDPCQPWSLLGVDAEGRAVLQEGPRHPVFAVPPGSTPDWLDAPERVFTVEGSDPPVERTLLRSGNFYGLGNVSPDGRFATLEAFAANDAEAVITLDLATGEPVDVAMLGWRQRTSWVKAAPGGPPNLVQLRRENAGFFAEGVGVDLPSLRRARWVSPDAGRRLLAQVDQQLVLYADDGSQLGRELHVDGVLDAAAADGDALFAVLHGPQCQLLTLDAATLRLRETAELPVCLDGASRLADGRWIGVANASVEGDQPGDAEVVLWDPAAEAVVPLTANAWHEEGAFPSRDGQRVWFHRRLEAWPAKFDVRTYRRQVCWTEIPPG